MLLTDYNEAETMELFKEEGQAEGRAEERRIFVEKLIGRGWTPQEAATFVGLSV